MTFIHPTVRLVQDYGVTPPFEPWNPNTPFTRYSRLSNRLYNRFDNRFDNCVEWTATVRSTVCQTGFTTGLTTGWMFVYTIQPVDNRVEWTATVRSTGCQTGLYNRIDNWLHRRYSRLSKRLSNGFDNRLNVCISNPHSNPHGPALTHLKWPAARHSRSERAFKQKCLQLAFERTVIR